MFSRAAFLILPLLAVATSAASVARTDAPTTACCSSTIPADSATGLTILKGLGIDISDVTGAIGLTCSPISVVGVGSGSACNTSPVSCTSGVFGGIGVGCIPISA